MDTLPSDQNLREIFTQKAVSVPEAFKTLYAEEFETIFRDTKAKIQKLLSVRAVEIENEVQLSIDNWVNLQLQKKAHKEYLEYFEKFGSPTQEKPHPFEYFALLKPKDKAGTIYERWKILKEKAITPGKRMMWKEKMVRVKRVRIDCQILLENHGGSVHPSALKEISS